MKEYLVTIGYIGNAMMGAYFAVNGDYAHASFNILLCVLLYLVCVKGE